MNSSSSSLPGAPANTWQKQAARQKQRTNKKLSSWFVNKFSSKSARMLREQEEAAQQQAAERARRRPGPLSAVTNHQQANARRHDELAARPKPVRQRSFLRQQLEEMKRQSAAAMKQVQERIDGTFLEEENAALQALDEAQRFSDDESDAVDGDSDDDLDTTGESEDVHVVENPEDVLRDSLCESVDKPGTPCTARTSRTSSTASSTQRKSSMSSSLRKSSASSTWSQRRRSSVAASVATIESEQDREDEELAQQVQRDEYSEAATRRMSQAAQLYAEAISALDYALHPTERQPEPEPSSKPLLLGVKKGSNMPKSEWI